MFVVFKGRFPFRFTCSKAYGCIKTSEVAIIIFRVGLGMSLAS